MKRYLVVSLGLVALIALAVVVGPAAAEEPTNAIGFSACSNNIPGDVAIGEAQMVVYMFPVGTNQIEFVFYNWGPEESSITDIYFADGDLISFAYLVDADDNSGDPDVDFSQGATPAEPPGGNNCSPSWGSNDATTFFASDSDTPVSHNGVNPGEQLSVVFDLLQPYDDVIAQLGSGMLRIAIHVQDYDSGGSETFATNEDTAVTLLSFNARASHGQVILTWETGTELNNAGFNLYRSSDQPGTAQLVTPQMIAARGDAVSGGRYSFVDSPGEGNFTYWLEDVDYNGTRTLHGPVSVEVRPDFRRPEHRPVVPGS